MSRHFRITGSGQVAVGALFDGRQLDQDHRTSHALGVGLLLEFGLVLGVAAVLSPHGGLFAFRVERLFALARHLVLLVDLAQSLFEHLLLSHRSTLAVQEVFRSQRYLLLAALSGLQVGGGGIGTILQTLQVDQTLLTGHRWRPCLHGGTGHVAHPHLARQGGLTRVLTLNL